MLNTSSSELTDSFMHNLEAAGTMCLSQKLKINSRKPDVICTIYTLSIWMELKFDIFQQACNLFASDNVVVRGPGPIILRDDWGVAKEKGRAS
jgi:hypothetical protein